ncbi:MAG: glycoside hydrolase family 13 protein [Oscillibacter sp.]
MSEPFVFDPRCGVCKTPFGAVPCGQSIALHCRPLTAEGFSHCALVLFQEFSGAREERELLCQGPEEERTLFSLTLDAPGDPELLWYHFRLWREDGSGCVLDKTGYRSDAVFEDWQITVYRETPTPEWFGAGVTYQIFPDRYCRLHLPDPRGLVGDRTVHAHWDDGPDWRPDAQGEIRNRDFFGGSLPGITSKLDDLADLGVTTLYLCPIFESASNHRYNTADYTKIDPMLGTEADFRALCQAAKDRGMRVLLDGVFNHTGSQSLYFNADGFYPATGAAQSPESPYADWFSFHPWPDDYEAWWGIRTLPAVREESESYGEFIAGGENSVIRRWLRAGASGWRLDVADELPDAFIQKIRAAVEETDADAILLGEVWEDGSNKIAYSQRRRYLLGGELHGLMNYPFRTAAIAWLTGGDGADFCRTMEALRENYPPAAFLSAMNFLGTHDTPRILTLLGADTVPSEKEDRAVFRLSPQQRERGLERVRLAALLLFAFPGSPTVYYGDEAGMEGFEDPFNRRTYPWGGEDAPTKARFSCLGRLRQQRPSLQRGGIAYHYAAGPGLAFSRTIGGEITLAALNAGDAPLPMVLPWPHATATDALSGQSFSAENGQLSLTLPPRTGLALI